MILGRGTRLSCLTCPMPCYFVRYGSRVEQLPAAMQTVIGTAFHHNGRQVVKVSAGIARANDVWISSSLLNPACWVMQVIMGFTDMVDSCVNDTKCGSQDRNDRGSLLAAPGHGMLRGSDGMCSTNKLFIISFVTRYDSNVSTQKEVTNSKCASSI